MEDDKKDKSNKWENIKIQSISWSSESSEEESRENPLTNNSYEKTLDKLEKNKKSLSIVVEDKFNQPGQKGNFIFCVSQIIQNCTDDTEENFENSEKLIKKLEEADTNDFSNLPRQFLIFFKLNLKLKIINSSSLVPKIFGKKDAITEIAIIEYSNNQYHPYFIEKEIIALEITEKNINALDYEILSNNCIQKGEQYIDFKNEKFELINKYFAKFQGGFIYLTLLDNNKKNKEEDNFNKSNSLKLHLCLPEGDGKKFSEGWSIAAFILMKNGVNLFKIVRHGLKMSSQEYQAGKDITIYAYKTPSLSQKNWCAIMEEITATLVSKGVKPGYKQMSNEKDKDERYIKGSSFFSYRYGFPVEIKSDPMQAIQINVEGQGEPIVFVPESEKVKVINFVSNDK